MSGTLFCAFWCLIRLVGAAFMAARVTPPEAAGDHKGRPYECLCFGGLRSISAGDRGFVRRSAPADSPRWCHRKRQDFLAPLWECLHLPAHSYYKFFDCNEEFLPISAALGLCPPANYGFVRISCLMPSLITNFSAGDRVFFRRSAPADSPHWCHRKRPT